MMMSLFSLTTVLVLVLARQAHSQYAGTNAPNDPLWPLFIELLSSQTGRTVQDLNTLGLSDPVINELWTAYSAKMPRLSGTSPTATAPTQSSLPPMPDLYQTSYSFSTETATQNQPSTSTATDPMAVLLNMINQPSTSSQTVPTSPTSDYSSGVTSAQDVMSAYAQLFGGMVPSGATTSTAGQDPSQALWQQYSSMSGASPAAGTVDLQALINQISGAQTPTAGSSPSQTSYQSLVDQYNSMMNQAGSATTNTATSGTPSYDQLLQQYNQIMGGGATSPGSSPGASTSGNPMDQYMALLSQTSSTTGSATNDQMLQMYAQLLGGVGQTPTVDTTSNTSSQTSSTSSSSTAPQDSFEQQLATFFPQFQSLFPQTSSGGSTPTSSSTSSSSSSSSPSSSSPSSSSSSPSSSASSSPAASDNTTTSTSPSSPGSTNTAQMIFDALLFGPTKPAAAAGGTATAPSAQTQTAPQTPPQPVQSPMSAIQNMVNSGAGPDVVLRDHVQNVLKTRASRDMGCRFLPELLELDMLPTAPIDCRHRCPFPYINPQQFGIYCVCCPPGVNDQVAGMMSLLRSSSYMETPLAVIS